MALIQGGGALNFLGPSTYNFMCGMKPADVIVSEGEITDYEVKLILQKVPTTYTNCRSSGVCVYVVCGVYMYVCVHAFTCGVCMHLHAHVCVCTWCVCVCARTVLHVCNSLNRDGPGVTYP